MGTELTSTYQQKYLLVTNHLVSEPHFWPGEYK